MLARFLPIIRTFAPIVAGVSEMKFSHFLFYTVVGAVFWAIGVTVAGFYLGRYIPNIDKFIVPIILLAIGIPLFTSFIETIRTKERRKKLLSAFRRKKTT